jgi:hypothetical protein
MAKFDLKSAYRRAHFSGVSALQSVATSVGLLSQRERNCTTTDRIPTRDLALVSLCFTFGGSANPSEFSTISELIADLANIIMQHRDWKPLELSSKFIALTDNKPILEEETVEFATARELLIDHELSEFVVTEQAFIDDIFTVFPLLSDDHFHRGRNAALLSIDTMGRPTHCDDPLPRDPIVAVKKVIAEGTPTEKLVILGWQIDTRRMLIQLPAEKADAWEKELKEILKLGDAGKSLGAKRLETMQGRNINVATMIPGAMHFQSRMYRAIARAKAHGSTKLKAEERRDLIMLCHLIAVARRGISLNNVVTRMPDHLGRSDAFEGGIGGYDLTSGRAWRFAIPFELQHKKSQNFLEYLACLTQLMCMLVELDWKPGDYFMSIGDNTSALGWIQKSNFNPDKVPEQTTHMALSRYMTVLLAN